jgi:hypothetical protein
MIISITARKVGRRDMRLRMLTYTKTGYTEAIGDGVMMTQQTLHRIYVVGSVFGVFLLVTLGMLFLGGFVR